MYGEMSLDYTDETSESTSGGLEKEAKVKYSCPTIKHSNTKGYGEVEVQLYTFLTWVPDEDGLSASRSSCFTQIKEPPMSIN
jgi:hypothetical protein